MEKTKFIGYQDHFLGGNPLILSKENAFYVNSYLNEVKKRTDNGYRNNKSALKGLLSYIDKDIPEINKIDIRNYFNDILDQKEISVKSKETQRAYLTSFFFHVESLLLKKDIDYRNPVPNKKVYKFEKKLIDIIKQSERKDKLLTIDQLLLILDHCRKSLRKREFIFFALVTCTGARVSEIRSIEIKNINLDERYFETGFEKNSRKSTLRREESLLFFIPKRLLAYLKNYIFILKKNNEKWLFPTQKSRSFISGPGIEYFYRKIRKALGFHFSMHHFRHTMITNLKRNKCPQEYREGLLNHEPSTTQGKFYEHLSIAEKREIYDKYFPYSIIPYF
jgi:integrase